MTLQQHKNLFRIGWLISGFVLICRVPPELAGSGIPLITILWVLLWSISEPLVWPDEEEL